MLMRRAPTACSASTSAAAVVVPGTPVDRSMSAGN
jgi:hypothetical protein